LPAFAAAKSWGATTIEIDIVLTAEGEPIVLHDRILDRTTNGHGFAADLGLAQIRSLDAGAGFDARFAGTRVPTVAEALDWARREEMGVFVEIKEAERPDLGVDRVAEVIEATGAADRTIVIGFDHVVLKRAAERHPSIRTQAITPARHADIVGVLRAGGANSVSIELEMFHPDDAKALHDAGFSNRVSLPRPEVLATFCPGGRDLHRAMDRRGLIDTVSGDDVPFLARLAERQAAGVQPWLRRPPFAQLLVKRRMGSPVRNLHSCWQDKGQKGIVACEAGRQHKAMPDNTVADLGQIIAALRRELDEARSGQSATSEVLSVISRSAGDTRPVFEAIVARTRRASVRPSSARWRGSKTGSYTSWHSTTCRRKSRRLFTACSRGGPGGTSPWAGLLSTLNRRISRTC